MPTQNYGWTEVPGPVTPDVPYWVNQLAQEQDSTLKGIDERVGTMEVLAGVGPGGITDAAMNNVYNAPDSQFRTSLEARLAEQVTVLRQERDQAVQALADATTIKDTGWLDLRPWLRAGWTATTGTELPEYRKVTWPVLGEEMMFRGQLVAPANISGNSVAFTLNASYRPQGEGTLYFALGANTSAAMNAKIGNDGLVTFWTSAQSGALRPLNNIRFFRK